MRETVRIYGKTRARAYVRVFIEGCIEALTVLTISFVCVELIFKFMYGQWL